MQAAVPAGSGKDLTAAGIIWECRHEHPMGMQEAQGGGEASG